MDYSRLNSYQQCPRQYYNRYELELRKFEEDEQDASRSWGKALHIGLEAHYQGKSVKEAEELMVKAYPVALKEDDLSKTPESLTKVLREYISFYQEQDKLWEIMETEVKDKFEVEGISFTVVLDLVAKHKQDGGVYFWDHKTTGRAFSTSYWTGFDLNLQVSAYTDYVRTKYGSCAGALINGIAVGHRKRAYKGEPAGLWTKFERHPFNRTPKQLEQFHENVRQWNEKIMDSKQKNSWPMNEGRLCAWCDYKELCLTCNDEVIKETLYKVKGESEEQFNVEVEL